MSLRNRINELVTQRKTDLDAANKIIAAAAAAKRPMTGEETQEWEKRHAAGETMRLQIEQLETQLRADATLDRPRVDPRISGKEDTRRTAAGSAKADEERADIENLNFRAYLKGGLEALPEEEQERYQHALDDMSPAEKRALGVASSSTGGALVPQGFVRQLESAMLYYGGIIQAADYLPTDDGAALPWPTDNDTGNTGEQTAESGAFATTSDPSFGAVTFNAWMIDSGIVKVPLQLLDDSAFSVDQYLNTKLPERIGRKLNGLCTTGAGTTEPKGIVTAATAGVTVFGAAVLTYNDLIDLEYSVDVAYRNGPKVGFMMHDTTFKIVRKIVDSSNHPIWIAGGTAQGIVNNREPDRLNGYPLWRNNSMAVPAQGNKTILFGDFSKYKIRQVKQMRIVRLNELYMANGQVGFIAFQRYDGNLVDAGTHPVKYLTQGAS
jgi:HK97 family phage major capsid protein